MSMMVFELLSLILMLLVIQSLALLSWNFLELVMFELLLATPKLLMSMMVFQQLFLMLLERL
jgi:hypothetical protein